MENVKKHLDMALEESNVEKERLVSEQDFESAQNVREWQRRLKAVIDLMPGKAGQPWVPGRAFVYGEECVVEYFFRFEEGDHPGECYRMIRSTCGGLRNPFKCRPLDYVCDPKHLVHELERWFNKRD